MSYDVIKCGVDHNVSTSQCWSPCGKAMRSTAYALPFKNHLQITHITVILYLLLLILSNSDNLINDKEVLPFYDLKKKSIMVLNITSLMEIVWLTIMYVRILIMKIHSIQTKFQCFRLRNLVSVSRALRTWSVYCWVRTISMLEFLRTWEVLGETWAFGRCFSNFSNLLKMPKCLHDSTMHQEK